jgi:hypothetical protein
VQHFSHFYFFFFSSRDICFFGFLSQLILSFFLNKSSFSLFFCKSLLSLQLSTICIQLWWTIAFSFTFFQFHISLFATFTVTLINVSFLLSTLLLALFYRALESVNLFNKVSFYEEEEVERNTFLIKKGSNIKMGIWDRKKYRLFADIGLSFYELLSKRRQDGHSCLHNLINIELVFLHIFSPLPISYGYSKLNIK